MNDIKLYAIRAENRATKKREIITGPMSKEHADSWKPSGLKRFFRYFRVVQIKS